MCFIPFGAALACAPLGYSGRDLSECLGSTFVIPATSAITIDADEGVVRGKMKEDYKVV